MTKKEISWESQNGKAKVEIKLITEKTINADGDEWTTKCCELEIWAYADDKLVGSGEPVKFDHPVAVAKIGKLGLQKVNYDAIVAAIAEVQQAPEWQAKIKAQKKIDDDNKKYTHKKHPEECPHCHSFCYGDCQAN